ncbi:Transcriptional regulator protein [Novosphingobium sp. Rr 2-17]|uniref:TetR/AcrR family transcriptional regulator n=1 Tax=Novosphingobium sp. Rr 2-17 TaxID=555793 RepID=UPI000269A24F|nr:TetR/AcrR family transcriptional regulator [Novosphingobium sp. Rr 2-17]EIZ77331.1 Transcriptional regulator protein [Novosphingobium sp. Rr 2-17]
MPSSNLEGAAQPGRPRDKALDETILRVTLKLLAETGLESVTMAKICRLSGIPATSIYRRYPDAYSVIVAAIEHDLKKMQMSLPDQGSLRADLLAFVELMAHTLNEDRARMLAGMILPMHKDPRLSSLLSRKLEDLRSRLWRSIIERAIGRGELHSHALKAQPLDEVAQTMIFDKAVIRQQPSTQDFLVQLVDNVLIPALAFHR